MDDKKNCIQRYLWIKFVLVVHGHFEQIFTNNKYEYLIT